MENETPANEEKKVKWWVWWLLAAFVLIVLIPSLLIATAGIKGETAGAATIVAAVGPGATPQQLNAALADTEVVDTEMTVTTALNLEQPTALSLPLAGCHGQVWRKLIVYAKVIGSPQIAWRQSLKHEWCWRGSQIISWGTNDAASYRHFTVSGFCWFNTAPSDNWYGTTASHRERLIQNPGTLRTCARLSLQKTINPKIFYQIGGTYNKG